MSLHVSHRIPFRAGSRDSICVVSSTKEERVVLLVELGKLPPLQLELTIAAAMELRAMLPTRHPSP